MGEREGKVLLLATTKKKKKKKKMMMMMLMMMHSRDHLLLLSACKSRRGEGNYLIEQYACAHHQTHTR